MDESDEHEPLVHYTQSPGLQFWLRWRWYFLAVLWIYPAWILLNWASFNHIDSMTSRHYPGQPLADFEAEVWGLRSLGERDDSWEYRGQAYGEDSPSKIGARGYSNGLWELTVLYNKESQTVLRVFADYN